MSPSPPVPDSGRSTRYCTPRLPHNRDNLKLATSTRTYPTRTYGRALHVQRWLSDRYTTQTRFNFGDLPKSEGVKDSYIQDPNDPNKFLNVPRPLKPLPGTRGDYYNGAAWKDYQRHKNEWFKNKGCYYPDVWIRCGDGGLNTTMASANREVRKCTDKMMCDQQLDSAVRGSGLHEDGNRRHTHIPWPNWRDQNDMESVTSKDDLFSIASQTDSLVPQTIIDHNVDSISIGIANTIIDTAISKPSSATPASSETASTNIIAIVESDKDEALVSVPKGKELNTNELMAPPSLVVLSDPEISKAFRVAPSKPLQNSRSSTSVTAVNNVDMSTIRAFHHRSVSKNIEKGVQNSSTVASSPTLTSRPLISSPKPTAVNNSVMILGHDWDRGWNMDGRYHF